MGPAELIAEGDERMGECMKRLWSTGTAALCAAFLTAGAYAKEAPQASHVPSLTESLSRTSVSNPVLSPDGRFIAFQKKQTDWTANQFVRQLWLSEVATGRVTQLTRGASSATGAQWSPDGRWLAFVSDRDLGGSATPAKPEAPSETSGAEKPAGKQIWILPREGGEAWRLTNSPGDATVLRWAPDGQSIFFLAAAKSQSGKARDARFSGMTVVDHDFDQTQIWRADVAASLRSGAPQPCVMLTRDHNLDVRTFAIAADGTKIAFSAAPSPLLSSTGDEDIYLLDLSAGDVVRKLVALAGPDTQPMFSPDGSKIAFVTSLGDTSFFYANTHLAVVDLAAALRSVATNANQVRDLTANFDEDAHAFAWTKQGIYFTAAQKTANHIFHLDPVTAAISRVTLGNDWIVTGASVSQDGQTLAFAADDPKHLTEIYASPTHGFAAKRLTDQTSQTAEWTLGSVEVVSWRSQDGATIQGVLHKPADYDPTKKYPLLVKIHGGPSSASKPSFFPDDYAYPDQAFLAKGALILEPNYRGSAGYGAAFRALNVRNLGVGDMWDVMSGVDALIAKGIADPNRLAAMGWSEGGYISAFLTTHTNRFKAISVGAGISDWMTYYVSTDITPFTRQYLKATPWDDPQIYAKTSPITTIRAATTPTLIQAGSEDRRVPISDAFELYRGLRDQNVDSRLILYTGFGHGIDKPKSLLALAQSNLDWFSHYLWAQPIPAESALFGTSELSAPSTPPSKER